MDLALELSADVENYKLCLPTDPRRRSLIRQVSSKGARSENISCWCGEPIVVAPGNLRLGCNCLVHHDCLIDNIKAWTNINDMQEWGIVCPYSNAGICEYQKKFGRRYFITSSQVEDLKLYGEENCASVKEFLTEEDVEKFKRLQKEKCVHLSCGCYAHYDDLVRQVQRALEDPDRHSKEGILCPYKSNGVCNGMEGMYINRLNISEIVNGGLELIGKGLLPAFSPRSDPKHLSQNDVKIFTKLFDRHLHLGCGCYVHHLTALKYLRSVLVKHSELHVFKSSPYSGFDEGDYDNHHSHVVLACPHRDFCVFRFGQQSPDNMLYNLTEVDIAKVVDFNPEEGSISSRDKASTTDSLAQVDEGAVLSQTPSCDSGTQHEQLQSIIRLHLYNALNINDALIMAVERGQAYVSMILLEMGAAINFQQLDGTTALHVACEAGRLDLIRLLLDRGADHSHTSNSGSTPLHYAAAVNCVEGSTLLLNAGSQLDARDYSGSTALDIAVSLGHQEVTRVLESAYQENSVSLRQHATGTERSLKVRSEVALSDAVEDGCSPVSGLVSPVTPSTPLSVDEIRTLNVLCSTTSRMKKMKMQKQAGYVVRDPEELFVAMRDATTKRCPGCGYQQTHYHGHYCHHVREGCLSCKTHFCYRCLCSAEENLRDRGSESCCKCGGWSNWCKSDDLSAYLKLEPYPHDLRCGCPICPECRPSKPCQGCDGSCAVCQDIIKPGPSELTEMSAADVMQTEEQRAKQELEAKKRQLFAACRSGDAGSLNSLVPTIGNSLSLVDDTGMTPLHWASLCGHAVVAMALLSPATADDRISAVKIVDTAGCTCLHYACQGGHLEAAIVLLFYGAPLDCCDKKGVSPLVSAAREGFLSTVELLIDRGAEYLEAVDSDGFTALHHASMRGHTKMIQLLLERGMNVDVAVKGVTPLHSASTEGQYESAKLLLDQGAISHACDSGGATPIHIATIRGHESIVRLYLDRGVEVNIRDGEGFTPLHYAALLNHMSILTLLLDRGATVSVEAGEGVQPIHYACYAGALDLVKVLVHNGACVNPPQPMLQGSTPLHFACSTGQIEVVRYLLSIGVSVNIQDTESTTPLQNATGSGSLELVTFLLDQGASVNMQDRLGVTPLAQAASNAGASEIVSLLLQKGADPAMRDVNGMTCIFTPCTLGFVDIVGLLLDHRVDVNAVDNLGRTALQCANFNGHVHVVELLLHRGGNVYVKSNDETTLLHTASARGDLAMAELLVAYGSLISGTNNLGSSALHISCAGGHLELLKFYLDQGAVLEQRDKDGCAPLLYACASGKLEVVDLLVGYSADINGADTAGNTALHVACRLGFLDIAVLLISKGVGVNVQTNLGYTALLAAAVDDHLDVVTMLLEHAGDAQLADNTGRTPLHWASGAGNIELVSLLLLHGARVDAITNDKRTPLHWAAAAGHCDIVELLLVHAFNDSAATKSSLLHLVNIQSTFGLAPLHEACAGGHSTVVATLLQNGADITMVDHRNRTSLDFATLGRHRELMKLLTEAGAARGWVLASALGLTGLAIVGSLGGLCLLLSRYRASN